MELQGKVSGDNMATWPTTLPQCSLLRDRAENPVDNRITTETETGNPNIRKRNTAAPTIFPMGFVLTSAQYDILLAFYNDYIVFEWIHPRTHITATRCRIREIPSNVKVGVDKYSVTFPLEVMVT